MADVGFGFTEGSFLLFYGQKHLRSVAKDLISKKEPTNLSENGEGTDIIKISSQYFSTGHNFLISARRMKINIT